VEEKTHVDRADTVLIMEDEMDLTSVLAVVVAVVVALSGYFLFNDMPALGRGAGARRSSRRP
jgi:hypothetical protein